MSIQQENHEEIKQQIGSLKTDICELKDAMKQFGARLDPIAETYETVIRIGGWAKWGLGFILLIISIFIGLKNLLNK